MSTLSITQHKARLRSAPEPASDRRLLSPTLYLLPSFTERRRVLLLLPRRDGGGTPEWRHMCVTPRVRIRLFVYLARYCFFWQPVYSDWILHCFSSVKIRAWLIAGHLLFKNLHCILWSVNSTTWSFQLTSAYSRVVVIGSHFNREFAEVTVTAPRQKMNYEYRSRLK